MKLIHTADLHIGKIVNEFSMLKDQKYILEQILLIVEEENADGLIIAGDIYDRSVPPAEAVSLLDWFLSTLIKRNVKVFMISGNHDSAERVGFASQILDAKGLYIGGTYDGSLKKVTLDEDGMTVDIYLLPFVKPQIVNYYEKENLVKERGPIFDESDIEESVEEIRTFESGVLASLSRIDLNEDAFNILVTHHFVTCGGILPEQSDSENSLSLGGIDKVDTSVFDEFDYVALGHIHRPQRIGRDTIRYAGSPLKYSFSEVTQKKSVTVLEIKKGKQVDISVRPLQALHDMRKIRGNIKDLMNPEYYQLADTSDYIQATLTDEVELIDPIGTLRSVYPNIMQIILEKNQQETKVNSDNFVARKSKSALELFDEFYEAVTGREFDEKRRKIIEEIYESVTGGEK